MRILAAFIVACLLFLIPCSCEKEQTPQESVATVRTQRATTAYTTYHILQGNHYCNETGWVTTNYNQKFYFKFNKNCWYDYTQVVSGWNKLYGFSDFINSQNSLRLGWRSFDKPDLYGWFKPSRIAVCLYAYVNSTRVTIPIDTVYVGYENYAELRWENGSYVAMVNKHYARVLQPNTPSTTWQQYPYFGGESVAPHDMEFYINRIQ